MAPTLIASSLFHKDIGKFAHRGETCLLRFGYLFTSDALYKLSQIQLIEPKDEIHTYIRIERVGATDDNYSRITRTLTKMINDDVADEEIIKHLLSSGYLDESKNVDAGRIALKTFFFIDDSGQEIAAPQVAGVKVDRQFQQQGLSSRAYMFILHWFEHLVCDEEQTVQGAKIWAGRLYDQCNVRIYNGKELMFKDRLSELGVGAENFLPWNKGMLVDLSGWTPNKVQQTVQKFIVLIISRNTSPSVGYCPE